MSKWILCEKEMPKKEVGKIVWFSFLGESPDKNWCNKFVYRPTTGWTYLDNNNDYVFTLIDYPMPPVAWMPVDIPVPYSVETETTEEECKECVPRLPIHMKDIYDGIMDGIKIENDENAPFDLDGDIFYYTFAEKGLCKIAINLEKIYLNGFYDGLERGANAANDE